MEILENYHQYDFTNAQRNSSMGQQHGVFTKTGTTIVGFLFDGGVILGADTRSTGDNIVANRNCMKIHYIADNMYCCGAGTAADTFTVTNMVRDSLILHSYKTGRLPMVGVAKHMIVEHLFQYQGHKSAALILGGFDRDGAHLVSIQPHGSYDQLPYVTMGSGSLAAMSQIEGCWKPNLTRAEAIKLCVRAIEAGITNDEGSGSNVNVVLIDKNGVEKLYNISQKGTLSATDNTII